MCGDVLVPLWEYESQGATSRSWSFLPPRFYFGSWGTCVKYFCHQTVLPAREHTALTNSFMCIYIFSFITVILSEIYLSIVMLVIELWALHRPGRHPTTTASFFVGRGPLRELVRLALYSPFSPGRCWAWDSRHCFSLPWSWVSRCVPPDPAWFMEPSFSSCLRLVYKDIINFCILTFYPTTLQNSFISSSRFQFPEDILHKQSGPFHYRYSLPF